MFLLRINRNNTVALQAYVLPSAVYVRKVNKGRFCDNSEIETLNSKRLSVENKAKLSQLEIVRKVNMANFSRSKVEHIPSLCAKWQVK